MSNDERRDREGNEEFRELLEAVAELPREIQPGRDLWPGVEARVRAESTARTAGRRSRSGSRGEALRSPAWWASPRWLAAAAVALVALTAATTLWLAGGPDGRGADRIAVTDRASAGAAVPVALSQLREGYRPALERLTGLLEARDENLPPETREVLERNLRIIDAAIAESERALLEHPESAAQVRALDRSYRRKVDLLERSVRLTAQM